jgi:hypothetical protein
MITTQETLARPVSLGNGAGLLTAVPVALFPVWLIVLSYRLPGHLLAGQAWQEDGPRADLAEMA